MAERERERISLFLFSDSELLDLIIDYILWRLFIRYEFVWTELNNNSNSLNVLENKNVNEEKYICV